MLTTLSSGDTAWILACTAFAFLAVPGLALFYGGLFPKKNPLSIFLPCLLAASLVFLQWILFGYSLSFGPDHNGWIGTLAQVGLHGIGTEPNLEYAGTIPSLAFVSYHAMLAAIAVIILLAAFADRMKLSSLCVFAFLWTTLVYDPTAHWVWSVGGFLRRSNVIDFAGGSVTHLNAAISALAAAWIIGKPQADTSAEAVSENPLLVILGGLFLWLGWFGWIGGRALSAGPDAAGALAATQASAIAGGLLWTALDGMIYKQPTLAGFFAGAVAGLVAITPAAQSASVLGAVGIGFGTAIICYGSFVFLEKRVRLGTSIFPIVVHGVGGVCGLMIVGQPLIQMKAVLGITLYAFGMSYVLLKMIDYVIGLTPSRPPDPSEA